jgi:Uma2 family endonuclease
MTLPGRHFTYEDYLLLPEDQRYELIEGELSETPTPNVRHQRILRNLLLSLSLPVTAGGLGEVLFAPTDVILANDTVVQPDLLFVSRDRQSICDPLGGVHGAPDLVVEILSPSTAGRDQVAKRTLYGKYGVREYWIVDPDARSIEVLSLGAGTLEIWRAFPAGAVLTSAVLPGLRLGVTEVFE